MAQKKASAEYPGLFNAYSSPPSKLRKSAIYDKKLKQLPSTDNT